MLPFVLSSAIGTVRYSSQLAVRRSPRSIGPRSCAGLWELCPRAEAPKWHNNCPWAYFTFLCQRDSASTYLAIMPAPTYLISRIGDPIFALFIGLSAAATRINREEKELGHTTKQTIDAGFRYVLACRDFTFPVESSSF